MRQSPQRHPLAVLRTFLGLGQEEMAKLADCTRHTIQAVELERLNLSRDLAARLSKATGISVGWLLGGDTSKPMVTEGGSPYSMMDYFFHAPLRLRDDPPQPLNQKLRSWTNQQIALEAEQLLKRADKVGKWPIARAMILGFLDHLRAEIDDKNSHGFDLQKAAESFSSRWEDLQEKFGTPAPLRTRLDDKGKIIWEDEMGSDEQIAAKVLERQRMKFVDNFLSGPNSGLPEWLDPKRQK